MSQTPTFLRHIQNLPSTHLRPSPLPSYSQADFLGTLRSRHSTMSQSSLSSSKGNHTCPFDMSDCETCLRFEALATIAEKARHLPAGAAIDPPSWYMPTKEFPNRPAAWTRDHKTSEIRPWNEEKDVN
ncbi:hypothetical protein B0T21DRAFT_409284 [Apiosordaria backusii]|uniref:Uncharacterized protein n=1 Tax=Apiosordaria backusii TaxID=314023 RepID=A0AA40END2_9PEZI|nr:hypothetical protein B0T21DRAFT_409284 [Apiosordaria backusii]